MSVIPQSVIYKESGIPWVGKIPEHWSLKKCKYFFVIQSTLVGDLWSSTQLLSLTLNGIVERDINNPEGKFPSDFSTYQLVRKNDLVFCLFDVEETPRTIGLSTLEGMITSAYTVIEVQNQDERFMAYFFINLDNYKNLRFLYRGLRKTIAKEDLLNLKIPLPPLQEQQAIANFLDKKTQKIEDFITKKQKLITLLEEKKQTLINQCVTQGLDSSIPLKDSGVEWLGQIPTHWEVRRLASFGSFSKGGNISRGDLSESGNSVILYGDIYTKYEIKTSNLKSKVAKDLESLAPSIYKGDILLAGSGETKEDIGKAIVYQGDEKAFAGGDVIILRQIENDSLFLSYSLNSQYARAFKAVESKGEIIVHIYASNLRELKIPIPPLEEQKAIAEYLDTQIEKIDLAICKIKSQINLIKEYKTTLISEAVCGRAGIN